MNNKTLGFIGGGNMAAALIAGLIQDGADPANILVAEPDEQRRENLAAHHGVRTNVDNLAVAAESGILVLSVKPQIMKQVARSLAPTLAQNKPLCLSIAAGIRHHSLQDWLGAGIPLVRTMPNTPAMLQAGATGLYAGSGVSQEQKEAAERIMRSVGLTAWLDDEAQMDALTAVSGSGPAYFFLFMEAMERSAEELGMDANMAHLLVLQTALGAARMAIESNASLSELRKGVTSPGGTTEQAIMSFEEQGLRSLVTKAMTRARDRSVDMSKLLAAED